MLQVTMVTYVSLEKNVNKGFFSSSSKLSYFQHEFYTKTNIPIYKQCIDLDKKMLSVKNVNVFLSISFNMCFGCSLRPFF